MFLELYVQIQHLCFVAGLSSLQIRYHHYIAVGSGIAEIVGGLFKAVIVKFKRKVGGSSEDVVKVQVSRLTNQKCKKANERRELEDGLEVDKGLASSFSAAACFSFFMILEKKRQQTTRNAWTIKTNIAEKYLQTNLFFERKCTNSNTNGFSRPEYLTQPW